METHWIPFSHLLRIIVVEQVFQVFDQFSVLGWWCQGCWGGNEGVSGEKHCGFTLASRATSIKRPFGCQRCLKERGYAAVSVSVGQIAFRMMSLVSPPTRLSSEWVIKTAAAATTAATSAFLTDWRWFFHLSGLSHQLDSRVSEGSEPPAGWMGG